MLKVCEIFTSIQGESSHAGLLCTFVRLAGCNLRCVWCDTKYSYEDGTGIDMSVEDIMNEVGEYHIKTVEITGGEPLMQPETAALCEALLDKGYNVLLETNGSLDISVIPDRVCRIVDFKCPGSGSGGSFFFGNLKHLTPRDELKFVLASIEDAEWAMQFCFDHYEIFETGCEVIFSPVSERLTHKALADWMVDNKMDGVRLGLQLHKLIWGENARLK